MDETTIPVSKSAVDTLKKNLARLVQELNDTPDRDHFLVSGRLERANTAMHYMKMLGLITESEYFDHRTTIDQAKDRLYKAQEAELTRNDEIRASLNKIKTDRETANKMGESVRSAFMNVGRR